MTCQTIASPLVTKNQDFITRQEEPLHDPPHLSDTVTTHSMTSYFLTQIEAIIKLHKKLSLVDRNHHQYSQEQIKSTRNHCIHHNRREILQEKLSNTNHRELLNLTTRKEIKPDKKKHSLRRGEIKSPKQEIQRPMKTGYEQRNSTNQQIWPNQ